MGLSEDIDKLLEDFGTNLKDDLQESLRNEGVTFGGQDSKLSNKIRFVISDKGGVKNFKLIMPLYGFAVDEGRKAAGVSREGQVKILDWTKRKGIVGKFQNDTLQNRLKKQAQNKTDKKKKKLTKYSFEKSAKQLTYLISRKLKQEGYKGNQFYSKVVNDGRLEEFKNRLIELIKTDIIIEIKTK